MHNPELRYTAIAVFIFVVVWMFYEGSQYLAPYAPIIGVALAVTIGVSIPATVGLVLFHAHKSFEAHNGVKKIAPKKRKVD